MESTKKHMRYPGMDDGMYMPMHGMPMPYRPMCPQGQENHMEMFCINMYMSAMCEAEAYKHKVMYYENDNNNKKC
ncbi:MAG: hypothetical protein LR001_04315 [Clostridiales bacterium]|nr:hypothetical protein [Clostridiales bacterium]